MKRLLSLLLCLVLCLSLLPAAAAEDIEIIGIAEPEETIAVVGTETAEAVPNASGSCGDNLTWTLDSGGTLTISGLGEMTDWSSAADVPWHGYTSSITALSIGSGVSSIGDHAFCGCSRLTSVTIPDSVTIIWNYAFQGCSSLESVTIGKNVTSIGLNAFYECTALKSAAIPDSVTDIRYASFSSCSSLESVLIGTGVKKIWSYAFFDCGNLTDVYYRGTKTQWNSITVESNNESLLRADMHYVSGTPEITGQPQDVSMAKYGDTVVLSVEAEGFALEYQWMTRVGSNWLILSDATSPTYSFEIKQSLLGGSYSGAGDYRCKVSNSFGSVYSRAASVTVDDTPTVIDQPQNVSAMAGDSAAFSVYAIGPDRSYQWQYRTSSTGEWKDSTASSAKTATLSITAESYRSGYQYRCMVYNDAGSVYSDAATLTVTSSSKPTITTQPKSVTVAAGGTAKFTVAATGAESYQWQWRSSSSGSWADCSSATTGYRSATLQVSATAARNGYQYRCKVTNSAGTTTSSTATLTVTSSTSKPTITTQPKSVTAAAGGTAKFTVAASGGSLSYQWQWRSSSSGSWTDCTSATTGYRSATLQVSATAARNGYQYRCKVTNSAGTTTSSTATLTVTSSTSKPTITTQPTNKTAAAGSTAKFTVAATGATGYQWQWRSSSSGTWADCTSATTGYRSATLQVSATTARNGYQYRCKVTNAAGTTTSGTATLTVVTKPTITTQPTSKTATAGTTVNFTVAAKGGALSYQWQYRSSSSASWSNCSGTGAATATLSVEAKAYRNGYQYRCLVKNAAGEVYSNTVTLTVK